MSDWLDLVSFPNTEVESPHAEPSNITVNGEASLEADILIQARRWMYIIVPVITFIIGIPGNAVACVVFRRRAMRNNFLSKFFLVLCANNIFCITWGLTRHFLEGLMDWNVRLHSHVTCYVHSYLLILSMCYGNWLLVIISACRTFYIANPERFNKSLSMCQTVALLLLVLVCIGVPLVFLVKFGNWVRVDAVTGKLLICELSQGSLMSALTMSFFAIIPGIMLFILNSSMYWFHTSRIPDSMMHRSATRAVRNQLYLMIVLTNVLFLVTNMPLALFYSSFAFIFDVKSKLALARARFGLGLAAMLFYIGQSLNIVLYSVFGSLFRSEVKRVLRPILLKVFPEWEAMRTVSLTEFSSKNIVTGVAEKENSELSIRTFGRDSLGSVLFLADDHASSTDGNPKSIMKRPTDRLSHMSSHRRSDLV